MAKYKIVTLTDTLPGTATIVDEKGGSILALHDGTPIFRSREIADRVLALLNDRNKGDDTTKGNEA